MAQVIEEKLLEAIQKDDVKAFNALMENAQCGSYRLGRFPVLSLLYLYKSRKIISAYEEKFLRITAWEVAREPASVAKAFSDRAGKCLRLYLDEIVSPLEMLLILNRIRQLKRVYPMTKPSAAIKGRLQAIYRIRYGLNIKYEGNAIIPDRRPLSYGEKRRIAKICLCSFLAVAVVVATPTTLVAVIPHRAAGEVTKLSHIDFSKKTTYTLTKDIFIPDNFSVGTTKCSIEGNGKKLIFGKGANLGEFSGKISGVEIISSGSPLFSTITEKAEVSNVTLNVTADIQTGDSTAFIALTNYGFIDGVSVNISGSVSAVTGDRDVTIGGMVLNNYSKQISYTQVIYGTINNCTVSYSNLSLEGETHANCVFAGIAGINNGLVVDSKVTGSITSDTVDLAGVCSINNYGISGVNNEAALTQVSDSDGWNPVVSGIAIENTYVVEYCENRGFLSAKSNCGKVETQPEASVSGIAHINGGRISYSKSSGTIEVEGNGAAYAGGIAAHAYNRINYCVSSGDIIVRADTAYAGGIFGRSDIAGANIFSVSWGFAEYCIGQNKMDVTASGEHAFVGGIAGFVSQGNVVDENKETLGYFGGGVTNCIFMGSCEREVTYFGNIAGVSGANILYGTDIYEYFIEYVNYENNYHLTGSLPAFGATAKSNGDDEKYVYEPVEGKDAIAMKREDIKELDIYKQILEKLEK